MPARVVANDPVVADRVELRLPQVEVGAEGVGEEQGGPVGGAVHAPVDPPALPLELRHRSPPGDRNGAARAPRRFVAIPRYRSGTSSASTSAGVRCAMAAASSLSTSDSDRPVAVASRHAAATISWARRTPTWPASAIETASAFTRPPVRARFAAIAWGRTTSVSRAWATAAAAPATAAISSGSGVPLRLPAAQSALVFLRHGAQHGGHEPRCPHRGGQRHARRHRVPLLRHRG